MQNWQAHDSANYDEVMRDRCSALLDEINKDKDRRKQILNDPRNLHRELYSSFAPAKHPEYAGAYRGTPNTTLFDRTLSSPSVLNPGKFYDFISLSEVGICMDKLLTTICGWFSESNDDYGKLLALAYAFSWFGKIHPFLDGNGHIQRAIFAAVAVEFNFQLSPRFAIHPRPYGKLFAIALEICTKARSDQSNEQLDLVAEYLGFFLDGHFNSVRMQLSTVSPYIGE